MGIPDCKYMEHTLVGLIPIYAYDQSPIQTILYEFVKVTQMLPSTSIEPVGNHTTTKGEPCAPPIG